MGPGGSPSLQNWCDLTTSGLVGSIPTRPRHAAPWRRAAGAILLLAALVAPSLLYAQRADSARTARGPAATPRRAALTDSLARRPVSPRGAFLRSVLVPGWGQAKLDRGTAGAIFATVEAVSLAMLLQSRRELRVAEAFARDSVLFDFDVSSNPPRRVYRRNPIAERVQARRQHVEDWAALLVANHLLAGAEAFVAAHLWDVPGGLSVRRTERGAIISARIAW